MTSLTDNMKLPYPDPTDALSTVDDAIKALAEKLDGIPYTSVTPGAGWSTPPVLYWRAGLVLANFNGFATSAAVSPGAILFTVNQPEYRVPVSWRMTLINYTQGGSNVASGGANLTLDMDTAGVVRTSTPLAAGDACYGSLFWPAAM